MTYWGYKPVFDEAERNSQLVNLEDIFPVFHDHPELFHFLMAPSYQNGPDGGSLRLALELNQDTYHRLYSKGPSLVGRGSLQLDGVESRHILLMTFLLDRLKGNWGNVVEIGAGYGNCFRLVDGLATFDNWSIVDLPYVLQLQKWFLEENRINLEKVSFIRATSQQEEKLEPDLIIATHSLSELSLEDFNRYLDRLINYSTWFFYVCQTSNPSKELLDEKLRLIQKTFSIYDKMEYEGGTSVMYLFKRA